MNIEYEYSFKVTTLDPFIKFLEENKFTKKSQNYQKRILYKKNDNTMARITINDKNNKNIILDFKDDEDSDKLLKERRETLPLKITDINIALSIIDFLKYEENKTLIRTRYIYNKNDVTFELDEYQKPEKVKVVALEGNKDKVDLLYNEITKKFSQYFIK